MRTVKHILRAKAGDVLTVSPTATVYQALSLMARHDIGALVVLDRGQLVGMFSERDYARKVALHGKTSKELLVAEIMTSPVHTVRPDDTVHDCMALMTARRIRHLPVVDGSGVTGLVSIGDVVKDLLHEQEFIIQQLEHYITT
jgi:CBS domain-containing protein